jgi:hypothetical protein
MGERPPRLPWFQRSEVLVKIGGDAKIFNRFFAFFLQMESAAQSQWMCQRNSGCAGEGQAERERERVSECAYAHMLDMMGGWGVTVEREGGHGSKEITKNISHAHAHRHTHTHSLSDAPGNTHTHTSVPKKGKDGRASVLLEPAFLPVFFSLASSTTKQKVQFLTSKSFFQVLNWFNEVFWAVKVKNKTFLKRATLTAFRFRQIWTIYQVFLFLSSCLEKLKYENQVFFTSKPASLAANVKTNHPPYPLFKLWLTKVFCPKRFTQCPFKNWAIQLFLEDAEKLSIVKRDTLIPEVIRKLKNLVR